MSENPKKHDFTERNFTTPFLKWINEKKIFTQNYKPITINILDCLINKVCTSDNHSKDVRGIIKGFMEQHFNKLLEISCPITTTRVMTVSLENTQIEVLETFKNLGFCCSRSEVLRFILFYKFLRGDES